MRERERERIKEREIIVDSCIVHNERVYAFMCETMRKIDETHCIHPLIHTYLFVHYFTE